MRVLKVVFEPYLQTIQKLLAVASSILDFISSRYFIVSNIPRSSILVFSVLFIFSSQVHAANYKEVQLHPEYEHDRFVTQPTDIVRSFRAYMTSFDSGDDDDGDGIADYWRVPEFVAYEIRKFDEVLGKGPKRPSPWITEKDLYQQKIAPSDASYAYSRAFRSNHKDWYDRGHMCAKFLAWRLGPNADWNTHTMLNAVPQRHGFNAGIWLDMEEKTGQWADKYNQVWIITGPIFKDLKPRKWIGEVSKGELPVAIPDGLFKIVIKDSDVSGEIDILAFYYPHEGRGYSKGPHDHSKRMVSIDWIEKRTGLDFLTSLDDEYEIKVERKKNKPMWE